MQGQLHDGWLVGLLPGRLASLLGEFGEPREFGLLTDGTPHLANDNDRTAFLFSTLHVSFPFRDGFLRLVQVSASAYRFGVSGSLVICSPKISRRKKTVRPIDMVDHLWTCSSKNGGITTALLVLVFETLPAFVCA